MVKTSNYWYQSDTISHLKQHWFNEFQFVSSIQTNNRKNTREWRGCKLDFVQVRFEDRVHFGLFLLFSYLIYCFQSRCLTVCDSHLKDLQTLAQRLLYFKTSMIGFKPDNFIFGLLESYTPFSAFITAKAYWALWIFETVINRVSCILYLKCVLWYELSRRIVIAPWNCSVFLSVLGFLLNMVILLKPLLLSIKKLVVKDS